jgi:hypothetical protein
MTTAPELNIQIAPKSNLPKKVMVWTGSKYEVAATVKKAYLTLPKEEKQALIDYAMLLGKKPSDAKSVWTNLVDAAVYAGSQGQKKNPWQILAETKSQIPAATPTPPTVSAIQYTPETATPIVDKVYMAALGRRAKPEEVTAILPELNAAELKTPTKTSYTKGPAGENIATVTGGVDETGFLTQKAKLNEEDFNRFQGQQFGSWLSRAMAGQDVSGG